MKILASLDILIFSKGAFSVKWRQGAPARRREVVPVQSLEGVITASTGQVQPRLGNACGCIGQNFGEAETGFRLSALGSSPMATGHPQRGLCANAFTGGTLGTAGKALGSTRSHQFYLAVQ